METPTKSLRRPRKPERPRGSAWTEQAAKEFLKKLSGRSEQLFEQVLKNTCEDHWTTIEEIKSSFGLREGRQVAGVLSGITSRARRQVGSPPTPKVGWPVYKAHWKDDQ